MFAGEQVFDFVDGVFGEDMHAKRVGSLSNAVKGVLKSGSLAIHAIGAGLAQTNELKRKHAVKQVDRLLSNVKLNPWSLFESWVPYVVGEREEIVVSLDWTEFDSDGHSTLVISQQTSHGRNTPLLWKSWRQDTLKNRRNEYEDQLLWRLKETLPSGVRCTVVADRGFCDTSLFEYLRELGFDYVIRIRKSLLVTDCKGKQTTAQERLLSGRARILKNVFLTKDQYPVERFVCTRKKGMKDAWYLACSREELGAKDVLGLYGKRWGIESSFRDIKDYKFGMGMAHMHTRSVNRRDRLFLLSALTIALLTLLGKAGDDAGLERHIKVNTSKTRTYSFWRQGCIYYGLLPGMKSDMLEKLMTRFCELLQQHKVFKEVFGVI